MVKYEEKDLWSALEPPERYNPIKPYFEGLVVSDLKQFSRINLEDSVEPKHRLLIISFWNLVILPFTTKQKQYNNNLLFN